MAQKRCRKCCPSLGESEQRNLQHFARRCTVLAHVLHFSSLLAINSTEVRITCILFVLPIILCSIPYGSSHFINIFSFRQLVRSQILSRVVFE